MTKDPKHIAVNARFLLKGKLEGIGRFSYEILKRVVRDHPEVKFSFFFDRPFDPEFVFAKNVKPYVLNPPARHPFLFKIWFDYSVTRKLKQLQPDLFFSPDGFLSLRTDIPQLSVVHDLSFEHFPDDISRIMKWYYRKYFPKFVGKAKHILAVSEYTKQDIIKLYKVAPEKISIVYNAASEIFHDVNEEEKISVRNKFTGGEKFIHFVGAIQPRKNIANLIRAFDQFKERTKSPIQLLIVGRKAWKNDEVFHTLENAAYKKHIQFTGYVSDEELNAIYHASEALVYVPFFEGFGIPIVEALQSNCPVITSNTSSMPEVGGDAALYADPKNPASIADCIERITSDQDLKTGLIHRGETQKALFSWDESARRVWKAMQNI